MQPSEALWDEDYRYYTRIWAQEEAVAMEVGIRELRDNLDRYLAEVRSGRMLTVTDHGQAIARMVPVDRLIRLERLRRKVRIQPARTGKQSAPEPIHGNGIVGEFIDAQRR
ncbi:type II toxin-antitoxin system prevent-host-death family antitoxin [Nocardia sp. NPDC051787]|uniref:type II toxin-antitoxin system Phd/YefM family antitoxin n=1 Tax=Nocardia sp. NPDC051787 TaxID=3155415 RepID=UPI00344591A9